MAWKFASSRFSHSASVASGMALIALLKASSCGAWTFQKRTILSLFALIPSTKRPAPTLVALFSQSLGAKAFLLFSHFPAASAAARFALRFAFALRAFA